MKVLENKGAEIYSRQKEAGLIQNSNCRPPSSRSKSVYIDLSLTGVPPVGQMLYFPSDDELNGDKCVINAIEVVDNTICAKSPANTSSDVLPSSTLSNGLFKFANEGREDIATLPIYSLIPRLNGNRLLLTNVRDQIWQNCGVYFNDVSGLSSVNTLWFRVYYTFYKDIPKMIELYG